MVSLVSFLRSLISSLPRIPSRRYHFIIILIANRGWKQGGQLRGNCSQRTQHCKLSESENRDFVYGVVSRGLTEEPTATSVCHSHNKDASRADMWSELERMPRLRAEEMLLGELASSFSLVPFPERLTTLMSKWPKTTSVAWVSEIATSYIRKQNLGRVILASLKDDDFYKANFVGRILDEYPEPYPQFLKVQNPRVPAIKAIASGAFEIGAMLFNERLTWLSTCHGHRPPTADAPRI